MPVFTPHIEKYVRQSGYGFTSNVAFGVSPKISGEYIASTRVAGKLKVPTLFKRTIYSVVQLPRQTRS